MSDQARSPSQRPPDPLPELDRLRAIVERMARRPRAPEATSEPAAATPPPRRQRLPLQPVIRALEASDWWRASAPPGFALTPTPGLANQTMADEAVRTMAVIVFGVDVGRLDRVVEMVAYHQSKRRDFRPVFLTDAATHVAFTRSNLTFEYFPVAVYGTGAAREYNPAFRARMSLLERKWGWSATLDLRMAQETKPPPLSASAKAREPTPDRPNDERWLQEAVATVRDSGLFDEPWYRRRYDIPARVDAVRHYLLSGAAAGFDPHPLFNTVYYARQLGKKPRAGR